MGKILVAAKCSQMSNPKAGTGSGGDRCVEATCAMIDATYKIGPLARKGADVEAIMYAFTKQWNSGNTVSSLESAQRIIDFVNEKKVVSISSVAGAFANVQTIIDRGHIAYTGVNDYRQLRLLDGGNPYQWDASKARAAGHVLLIVGYGDGVVVHDPLRAEFTGQPAEYSVTSFEAAGWDTIGEVVGPRLDTPPAPEAIEVKIQAGNTLWSLAEQYLGNGDLWPEIAAANPGVNPAALHIGTTITIPPKQAQEASHA